VEIYVNGLHFGTGRLLLIEDEWALRLETIDAEADFGIEQDAAAAELDETVEQPSTDGQRPSASPSNQPWPVPRSPSVSNACAHCVSAPRTSAKEDLAASMHHRLQGESMLRAAESRLEEARSTRRSSPARPPPAAPSCSPPRPTWSGRSALREAAELDLDQREAEVDARRTALESAARERQVLERLKDRRRAEHSAHAARVEGARAR
jgi:flagellar FliJ protein